MSAQILLVEDDDDIAVLLERALERDGYGVRRVVRGLEALGAVAPDVSLVLLDVNLPDLDGLEVCRRMRANGHQVPIMILSARASELDRVVGLDAGADDYLVKPFSLAELQARIRAVLRRMGTGTSAGSSADPPVHADLVVSTRSRQVSVGGKPVDLSVKEFDVLALLAATPGDVITRERLIDEVWDENWFGSTKTLDVTIGRLRQKLRDAGTRSQISTVRGVGFRLDRGDDD